MAKMLPNLKANSSPMTRGQRRAWLALEEQKRRRARAANGASAVQQVILLTSDGHGNLAWTLNFATPYTDVSIYKSADGLTWDSRPYDGWDLASGSRDVSGDPGYFRICLTDANGNDVLPYSNAVYSDGL